MKTVSDAQARALQLLAEYPTVVLLPCRPGELQAEPGGCRIALWTETMAVDGRSGRIHPLHCSSSELPRAATLGVLLRDELVSALHTRSVARYRGLTIDPGQQEIVVWHELQVTEDGVLALGLWRERRLHAPPPPLPQASDRDRAVLRLIADAAELGYAVVALKDQRPEARSLVARGFARRGWVGNRPTSLVATGLGAVEGAPQHADQAPSPTNKPGRPR